MRCCKRSRIWSCQLSTAELAILACSWWWLVANAMTICTLYSVSDSVCIVNCTVPYSIVRHMYTTVLYRSAVYCTVLYSTVHWSDIRSDGHTYSHGTAILYQGLLHQKIDKVQYSNKKSQYCTECSLYRVQWKLKDVVTFVCSRLTQPELRK